VKLLIALALVVAFYAQAEEISDPIIPPVEPFLTGNTRITVQASLLNISELTVSNNLVRASYTDLESAPKLITLQAAHRLYNSDRFVAFAQLNVGFAYLSGPSITSMGDGSPFADRANMLWMPMQFSLKAEMVIPNFTWVIPTITAGIGVNLLSQSGHSPQIAASHWIPSFTISPALLFMGHKKENDWFAGFSFGTTYHSSFAAVDRLRVWSIDLAFHIWL
jgi:hypothetical protein